MTDPRLLRDSIETLQTEVRNARAELATPLDTEELTREVEEKLAVLGPERARLLELIRGVRGLRACVEEARQRASLEQSTRKGRIGAVELATVAALVTGYAWCGVSIGDTLARVGFSPWIALGVGALACPVVFFDVAGLMKWFRGGADPRV